MQRWPAAGHPPLFIGVFFAAGLHCSGTIFFYRRIHCRPSPVHLQRLQRTQETAIHFSRPTNLKLARWFSAEVDKEQPIRSVSFEKAPTRTIQIRKHRLWSSEEAQSQESR